MSLYRAHPGICEPEPMTTADAKTALTYGQIDWERFKIEIDERLSWARRHEAELERRVYASLAPNDRPLPRDVPLPPPNLTVLR